MVARTVAALWLATAEGRPEIYLCAAPRRELDIADDWYAFAASVTGGSGVVTPPPWRDDQYYGIEYAGLPVKSVVCIR
jgi:hypothetical protein